MTKAGWLVGGWVVTTTGVTNKEGGDDILTTLLLACKGGPERENVPNQVSSLNKRARVRVRVTGLGLLGSGFVQTSSPSSPASSQQVPIDLRNPECFFPLQP